MNFFKHHWKIILSVACAIPLVLYVLRPLAFIVLFCFALSAQMDKGRRFMDSMTAEDFARWGSRTAVLLDSRQPNQDALGVYGTGGLPMPEDLKALGILRIDVDQNRVDYVWAGGMDRTCLEVTRNPDGSFVFTAVYNLETSRVLSAPSPQSAQNFLELFRELEPAMRASTLPAP